MARIDLEGIVKRYGPVTAVHGIDLEIKDGEFVVFVGPSGCGKSTTLRMIAGLEDISGGKLRIDGEVVNQKEPKQRNIAMVFQNYAIYPHMTVRQNIGFGLYTSKLSRAEKDARVLEIGRLLGLEKLLDRRPAALSGGQRQRVAIGRAMVRNPKAFLFDEPLSNLDAQLRGQMRLEIKQLHQRLGTTIVFVTHDQVEAMSLADKIVVMKDGRILQVGAPMELYNRPADMFTARFIGSPEMNMISAVLTSNGVDFGVNSSSVTLASDAFPASLPGTSAPRNVSVGLRPQDLALVTNSDSAKRHAIVVEGRIKVAEPHGSETIVHLELAEGSMVARAPSNLTYHPGEPIRFGIDPANVRLFDTSTEKLIH